jgi:hypothetical protein
MVFSMTAARLRFLSLLVALPLLSACDPWGEIYEITNDVISGWACDLDTTDPIEVDIYATNASPAFGGECFTEGADTYCFQYRGTADDEDDPVMLGRCGSRNRQFMFPVPAALKNNGPHKIIAFGINVGAGNTVRLAGKPIDYPNTLYRQGPIVFLDQHIIVSPDGTTQPKHIFANNCPIDPNDCPVFDHLLLGYYGMGPTPADTPFAPDYGPVTGFTVPGNTNNPNDHSAFQRAHGFTNGVNVVQAFLEGVGAYLTRQDFPSASTAGMVAIHNFRPPLPRVWDLAGTKRFRMEGYFKAPYTFTEGPGKNFLYMTAVFEDPSSPRPSPPGGSWRAYLQVKIFQTTIDPIAADWSYPEIAPPPAAPKAPEFASVFATMQPTPGLVTSCVNGASTTASAITTEQFFCFEVSSAQWQAAVQALNASPQPPPGENRLFHPTNLSTHPSDWRLAFINVNAESWNLWCDPTCQAGTAHLGFSFRDLKVSVVP